MGMANTTIATRDSRRDEATGTSVFCKDADGNVYHTYSGYARAGEGMLTPYHFLDLAPKGRDEEQFGKDAMAWVRHHDRYTDSRPSAGPGVSVKAAHECCGPAER